MNKLLLYPFCVDVLSREEEIVWKQCNDEEKKKRERKGNPTITSLKLR